MFFCPTEKKRAMDSVSLDPSHFHIRVRISCCFQQQVWTTADDVILSSKLTNRFMGDLHHCVS